MSMGQTLLDLQASDLARIRAKKTLAELPELKMVAQLRHLYKRLKAETTQCFAERKDIETSLAELDEQETTCNQAVYDAQREASGLDYRAVQDLEVKLSLLAKQLDKIQHQRTSLCEQLKIQKEREAALNDKLQQAEHALRTQVEVARDHADTLTLQIESEEQLHQKLAASLSSDLLELYQAASQQFSGLAVELLEGSVPSLCRMKLADAAVEDLHRGSEIGECPYCHRMLVVSRESNES
ncbi:hypothetical protein KPC83_03940 [Collinsella sp. zg1085]|uniref:zinc ribbon domain-containing protein n=1 Tax=Collinsella sp. zg1085 TaxID=2844380 RepID=UPI001C0D63AA|nr:hypothetical protein [Collinsella sp. zg1085]QWT17015.1 hypothetical protein KPC83_03940 [Collinsella sp. zg1085]